MCSNRNSMLCISKAVGWFVQYCEYIHAAVSFHILFLFNTLALLPFREFHGNINRNSWEAERALYNTRTYFYGIQG